jgi:CHASE2 domain-containing sensor protein
MTGQHTDLPGDSGAAHRRAHLRTEFWIAVLVLVVFTALKLWLGRSSLGHTLHAQCHVWLESHIPHSSGADLPVVIVDISNLANKNYAVGWTNLPPNADAPEGLEFTDRERLQKILLQLADAHPAAIGVDIDMSFEPELIPGPELLNVTTNLFETTMSSHTPVFFGIKRTEALPPDRWLVDLRYMKLAASLDRPVDAVFDMPSEYEFPEHLVVLKSLARAVAGTNYAPSNPPGLLGFIARGVSVETPVEDAPNFKLKKFPVDYSALGPLMSAHTYSLKSLTNISTFAGKIVLLGDTSRDKGPDMASVPGHGEPVPGVYVHACAVNTLVQSPLWELKPAVGLGLATLLTLLTVILVYRICHAYAARYKVTTVPLTILLTLGLIVLLLFGGIALARWFHVLWLELLAVCVVLLVHCLFEILFGNVSWKHFKEHPIKPLVVAPD